MLFDISAIRLNIVHIRVIFGVKLMNKGDGNHLITQFVEYFFETFISWYWTWWKILNSRIAFWLGEILDTTKPP